MTPRLISRKEAGLALPKKFSGWMKLPAPRVWVHHSVTDKYIGREAFGMRELQKIAFNRGFNDISYSWLIFNNGVVGEGRGWGVVGAHTSGHNSTSHGIVFVGNYQIDRPTDDAREACKWLIDEGVRLGRIGHARNARPDGGHRDLASTACPGAHVYTTIPSLRFSWSGENEEDEMAPKFIVHVDHPQEGGNVVTHLYFDDGVELRWIESEAEFHEASAQGYPYKGKLELKHALERRRLRRTGTNPPPGTSGWKFVSAL